MFSIKSIDRPVASQQEQPTDHTVGHYDFVFSLGEACFVATFLKEQGLRLFSGPFDWVYGRTFVDRFTMLLKDFEHFFEKQDIIYRRQYKLSRGEHDVYFNNHTKLAHIHDFSFNADFEKEYPVIKAKYDRRIKRLLDYMNGSKRILIVYAEMAKDQSPAPSLQRFAELFAQSHEKYQDKISVLYMKHNPDFNPGENTLVYRDERLYLVEYFGSRSGEVGDVIVDGQELIDKSIMEILSRVALSNSVDS
ncbi:MAG: papain-like cysteine peptidase [Kiritimatiellales bacterium]|nr:papain-like cysteine peptidase [Kiritimatiellales bacterium]